MRASLGTTLGRAPGLCSWATRRACMILDPEKPRCGATESTKGTGGRANSGLEAWLAVPAVAVVSRGDPSSVNSHRMHPFGQRAIPEPTPPLKHVGMSRDAVKSLP